MNEETELNSQDAPEIADRAFEALHEGDLETAQALALQLKELQYSAYFEIQALIFLRQDDNAAAIEILREGVSKAGAAWPLWQLLGNCLSDDGNYTEALNCYEHGLALDIDENSRASIQFNRATVLSRMGKHDEAWQITEEIADEVVQDNPSLKWHIEGFRLRLLAHSGDCAQVTEHADALEKELILTDSEDFEPRSVCWAQGGYALLECGHAERALEWAGVALFEDRTNEQALHLLRDARPDLPQASRYFQVLLQGEFTDEGGEEMGFFTSFSVVARVAEEAEQLALQMEAPRWQTPIRVSECRFEDECELQSIGVFDVGPYCSYPLDAEDEEETEL